MHFPAEIKPLGVLTELGQRFRMRLAAPKCTLTLYESELWEFRRYRNINIIPHQHVFLVRDVAIEFFLKYLNTLIASDKLKQGQWQLIRQFLCDIRGLFWTCQPIPPPNHSSLHCHMHSGYDMRFFFISLWSIWMHDILTTNKIIFSMLLSGFLKLFHGILASECMH